MSAAEADGDGGGGGAAMTTVAVAVKSSRGKGSRRAVRWAVEKLMWKADNIVLLHVMPTVTAIPTPCMCTLVSCIPFLLILEFYFVE